MEVEPDLMVVDFFKIPNDDDVEMEDVECFVEITPQYALQLPGAGGLGGSPLRIRDCASSS